MPDHRLTPKREGFSDKVTALDHFAYRVWQQYKLSADDYGVMPDLPASIQAGNRRLAKETVKAIATALAGFVDCGLLHRFTHQGQAYLYSRVWQEHQKIRYPSETFHPVPPDEELAQCEKKTRELFAQRLRNGSETGLEDSVTTSPPPVCGQARNAVANADANAIAVSEGEPERGYGRGGSLMPPMPRNTIWPGRPSVPDFLHAELRQRLAPSETEQDLVAFYQRTSEAWRDRPIGDDSPKFWRARFSEWKGTTVAPKTRGQAVTKANQDVLVRALARQVQ